MDGSNDDKLKREFKKNVSKRMREWKEGVNEKIKVLNKEVKQRFSTKDEESGETEVSEITQVNNLGQVEVLKPLGKGAFGLVSLIDFKGLQYAMKEI